MISNFNTLMMGKKKKGRHIHFFFCSGPYSHKEIKEKDIIFIFPFHSLNSFFFFYSSRVCQ